MTSPKASPGKFKLTIGYYRLGMIDSDVFHTEHDSMEDAQADCEAEIANLKELGQRIWFAKICDDQGVETVIVAMHILPTHVAY